MKPAYKPTPNSGGIIQANGQTTQIKPDPGYTGPQATGFGARTGESANPLTVPGGRDALPGTKQPIAPIASPPTTPSPKIGPGLGQVPNGTPISKDTNAVPSKGGVADATGFIPGDPNAPGGQLAPQGDSNPSNELAGAPTPTAQERQVGSAGATDLNSGEASETEAEQHVGGYDDYARTFTNPKSADIYHQHYQRLTGDTRPRQVYGVNRSGMKMPSATSKGSEYGGNRSGMKMPSATSKGSEGGDESGSDDQQA